VVETAADWQLSEVQLGDVNKKVAVEVESVSAIGAGKPQNAKLGRRQEMQLMVGGCKQKYVFMSGMGDREIE
jgi:hypothetical protein